MRHTLYTDECVLDTGSTAVPMIKDSTLMRVF